MRDPLEGVCADGTIRTGVERVRVPASFEPVITDAVTEFGQAGSPGAELHLYGSVATGFARPGESDVDLFVIDADDGWAADVAARLSRRYVELCRGVEIGTARSSDFAGSGDESYGNRVFLRHYCVSLAGPDAVRPSASFAADARAARGFNGDIRRCLARWRVAGSPARSIARKTLVTAAGIVSIRTGGWTTDRAAAVDAWEQIDDVEVAALRQLHQWAMGKHLPAPDELTAVLSDGGIVQSIADRFADEVGLWT